MSINYAGLRKLGHALPVSAAAMTVLNPAIATAVATALREQQNRASTIQHGVTLGIPRHIVETAVTAAVTTVDRLNRHDPGGQDRWASARTALTMLTCLPAPVDFTADTIAYDDTATRRIHGLVESMWCPDGFFARWCPLHGTCACPHDEDDAQGVQTHDGADCPLHGVDSRHAAYQLARDHPGDTL